MLQAIRLETNSDWIRERSQACMSSGDLILHAPSHVFQAPGGGENQLVQTGRALETLGHRVRLFSPWMDRIAEARCLHLFGMSREGLELARLARSLQIPTVLSTISWYEPRAIVALAGSKRQLAFDLLKWSTKQVCPRFPSWRRELLTTVDAILPNSEAEARQLSRLFGLDRRKLFVVPNGVDARFAEASPESFQSRTGIVKDFVLYVGRIEPRKNVLGLVRAANDAGLPLVLVGDAPPAHAAYLKRCEAAGGALTSFFPGIEHDDPALASAYAAARVFALPSWFETPGLAALEAGLARCSLVLTPNGCTHEYFGSSAIYPRTGHHSELVAALIQAWHSPPDPSLSVKIKNHYLWSDVARRTAEVYETVTS